MEFPIPEMTTLDDKKKGEFLKLIGPDKGRLLVASTVDLPSAPQHTTPPLWAVMLGYKNVYRHPGGIVAWKELDYPVGKVE